MWPQNFTRLPIFIRVFYEQFLDIFITFRFDCFNSVEGGTVPPPTQVSYRCVEEDCTGRDNAFHSCILRISWLSLANASLFGQLLHNVAVRVDTDYSSRRNSSVVVRLVSVRSFVVSKQGGCGGPIAARAAFCGEKRLQKAYDRVGFVRSFP
jgi:hypothetical protein